MVRNIKFFRYLGKVNVSYNFQCCDSGPSKYLRRSEALL